MKIQRNNKDIYMVWWPIFAVLLFVLSILALAVKVLETVMGYMEVVD